MTLLVFGKTGQVATELGLAAADHITALDRTEADLTDPAACAAAIRRIAPRAVINAAAYTNVDQAEDKENLATRINAAAPGAMAAACADLGIPLVHLSTDYVFSGAGTAPWPPEAAIAPIGAYGRSKAKGEVAVRTAGGVHAIVRTSWIVSAYGKNFVKTLLRLGPTRVALPVVADQTGGPTPARAIAQACLNIAAQLIVSPNKTGTYHFAGAPDTSWADFGRAIFRQAGVPCDITDIPSAAYPTKAIRPLNSRLDCRTTEDKFQITRPDWRVHLAHILTQVRGTDTHSSIAPPPL